jgi:ribosomal protein S18 acetylase RimI-like enzyme
VLLAPLERDVEPETLLMDGIFVAEQGRGKGVGTALLRGVKSIAHARGCRQVRLDVIDTNPHARRLYEREGFCEVHIRRTGPLRLLYGFRSATTMLAPVN